MTREDIEQLNVVEPYCFESDREEQWYNIGLKHGLEIADEHPKSPWVSVKDRMPYFNKELLLEKFNCTKKFLTRDDENNFYIQRMWKSNGFWKWEYPANIIHWFVIPELPKE